MRLLVVAPFLPDAEANHGGGSYLGTLCEALSARASLALVAFGKPDEMARLSSVGRSFAYVDAVPFPERPQRSGQLRHRLSMLFRWGLQGLPLVAAKHKSRAMVAALDRAVRTFAPDAVMVEVAQCAQYLAQLSVLPTVFTDHEAGIPANVHTDLGALADRRDVRLWQRYVVRHYPRAALVQAVTQEDAERLAALLRRTVAVRPPVVKPATEPVACSAAPPRALFLGNYAHHPNPEAAAVIAAQILPQLRAKVADAELWLAGPGHERIAALAQTPGVKVLGHVPDLHRLFGQVRLLLAPLYSGGGFRMKGLTALAHGVPVVTNALGARGFDVPPPARAVAEAAPELAAAALRLLTDRAAAREAGRAAHAWAQQHLSPAAVADAQVERIERLLAARQGR